jgi:hypothetical protein
MREIVVEPDIADRLDEFKQVLAEVAKAEPAEADFTLVANAVLTAGLDSMMADFFRRLDDDTLRKSMEQFHLKYPHSARAEPSSLSDSALVNAHVALSKHYPKQFFSFVFAALTESQRTKARERWEELFRK